MPAHVCGPAICLPFVCRLPPSPEQLQLELHEMLNGVRTGC